jgi:flagellar FliJ protein
MQKHLHLKPLLNLAHHRNDAAAKLLGQLNQQHHTATDKLNLLMKYKQDYQQKFQKLMRNGLDKTQLRNFQNFINRLDEAIAQQRQLISQQVLSVQAGREEWLDARRQMQSFDKLAERHEAERHKEAAKAEQKLQDEYTDRFVASQQTPED